MGAVEGRFEEDLAEELRLFRADTRKRFGRNCVGYCLGVALLLALSSVALWGIFGAAFWLVMLGVEAFGAYGSSEGADSPSFRRWQSRQLWLAARNGDVRSLKRLQNVR